MDTTLRLNSDTHLLCVPRRSGGIATVMVLFVRWPFYRASHLLLHCSFAKGGLWDDTRFHEILYTEECERGSTRGRAWQTDQRFTLGLEGLRNRKALLLLPLLTLLIIDGSQLTSRTLPSCVRRCSESAQAAVVFQLQRCIDGIQLRA